MESFPSENQQFENFLIELPNIFDAAKKLKLWFLIELIVLYEYAKKHSLISSLAIAALRPSDTTFARDAGPDRILG